MKAHQLQMKIAESTNIDNNKYIEDKEKKMKKEIDKLKTKQDNETYNLNLKMNKEFNEFNKERASAFDK
jgi:hypothetical protein